MQNTIFGSPLFGTIICLLLIYALLSLLVSTITEAVNSYFKERGTLLYKTISKLFNDNINVNFGQLLYIHPMIKNLKKDECSLPQYISAQMFSNAIIDTVGNYGREYITAPVSKSIILKDSTLNSFERFIAGVAKMHHTDLKLMLMNMIEKCVDQTKNIETDTRPPNNELDILNIQLQQWFNDQMERTSGWYKTYLRIRLFWISLFVALLLNVDSIHLFQTLYRSPDLRSQLEPIAENLADNYAKLNTDTTLTALQKAYTAAANTQIKNDSVKIDTTLINNTAKFISQLNKIDSITKNYNAERTAALNSASAQIDKIASLGLPIGWKTDQAPLSWKSYNPKNGSYFELHKGCTFWNVIAYLLGIILTAVALSFGAPFWFDLLLKAVNIRRAGVRPSTDKNN